MEISERAATDAYQEQIDMLMNTLADEMMDTAEEFQPEDEGIIT